MTAAAPACLLLTAGSHLGDKLWLLELTTHFRLQYAVAAAVLLVFAVFRRRPGISLVALLAAVANSVPLLPFFVPGAFDAAPGQPTVRIMSANVNFENGARSALRAQVELEDPDILGLLEVDDAWIEGLSGLETKYPYRLLRPQQGATGLALYSRYPVRERETSPYVEDGMQTAMTVDVDIGTDRLTLMLAHLSAPTTPVKAKRRNRQIAKVVEMLREDRNREQILVGDLNITPWSPFYAPLEDEAGLSNAAIGRGYLPSWPARLGRLGIPIDHLLVSEEIRVRQFRTGADNGSDHLPLIADVVVGAAIPAIPGGAEQGPNP